jgi:hypothetical protein
LNIVARVLLQLRQLSYILASRGFRLDDVKKKKVKHETSKMRNTFGADGGRQDPATVGIGSCCTTFDVSRITSFRAALVISWGPGSLIALLLVGSFIAGDFFPRLNLHTCSPSSAAGIETTKLVKMIINLTTFESNVRFLCN